MNSNDEAWNVASGSIYLNSTGIISFWADDEDEGRNDIYLKVGGQGNIYINDPIVGRVDTPLQYYPIKWASIANKPSNGDDSGVYLFKYTSGNIVLTTVLICTNQAGMAGENYTSWYLNNSGSWVSAPSGWKNSATKLF